MPDFSNWPATEKRQKLYVDESLSAYEKDHLNKLGWEIIDVRTLPNGSDAERQEGLKAALQGVRVGSIDVDAQKLRFLELEAKVHGKAPSEKKERSEEETDVGALLSLSSPRAFRGTKVTPDGKLGPKSAEEVLAPLRKKAHRPRGVGESKPRGAKAKAALPEVRQDVASDSVQVDRRGDDGASNDLLEL